MGKNSLKIKLLNIYVIKKKMIRFGKSTFRIDRRKIILSNNLIKYYLIKHIVNDSKLVVIENKHILKFTFLLGFKTQNF